MKIKYLFLICTWSILSVKESYGSAVGSPFYPLKVEDLTDSDIKEIEYWDDYYHRPKRSGSPSGSGDIVHQLKSAVVSGLKQKLGQVAQGSAGAVAGASAGASKGSSAGSSSQAKGHPTISYGPPPVEKPQFNLWELKKSVLNTLLQAVKAIQGGVLAIKGQLIKGSGYLVSGGGKLLAAGGDKVTELGKNIIHNSVLVPPSKTHPWHSASESYGAPASYSAPSGHGEVYDAPPPSAVGPAYIPESSYEGHYDFHDAKLHHTSDGLIILRRITPPKDKYSTQSKSTNVNAGTHTSSTDIGVGNLVGKILGLSSSGTPNSIAKEPVYDSKGNLFTPEDSHTVLSPPSPPHYEATSAPVAPIASTAPPFAPPNGEHSTGNIDFTFTKTNLNTVSNNIPFGADLSAQPSAYEGDGAFGNYQDYLGAQSSNKYENKLKLTHGELQDGATVASSQIQIPNDAPQTLESLKALLKLEQSSKPQQPSSFLYNTAGTVSKDVISTQNHDPGLASLANFLPTESPRVVSNYKDSLRDYTKSKAYPSSKSRYTTSSSRYKTSSAKKRKRTPHEVRYRRPSISDYEMIKSISYQLTPEGPKRLT